MKINNKFMLMRDTWVEINLDIVIKNFLAAKEITNTKTKIAAVLKANGYGHGAIKIAKVLIENGVDMLAVACLSEALELRASFKEIPILIMGYTADEYLKLAVKNKITLTIFTVEQAEKISQIASKLNKVSKIHIKLDTGFNRLGFKPSKELGNMIAKIFYLKNVEVEGIFTHLALTNYESDNKQFKQFKDIIDELERKEINIPIKHVCDSIGMVRYPEFHLDMIRLGALLYGVKPFGFDDSREKIKMPLTFKTKISLIKDIEQGEGVGYDFSFKATKHCRIGTLPVGYADGYMRCLSNIGEVSVIGKRAKVVGKICMDQCMIDLTNIPEAQVGDEVVLLGESIDDEIPILEVAEKASTNRNEILSIISRRVPRVYIRNKEIVEIVNYLID